MGQAHRAARLDKSEKSLKILVSTEAQLVKSECPPTRIKVAFLMQSRLQQREMSSPLDIHFGIAEVLVSFWTVGALPLCPNAVHPQCLTFSVDPLAANSLKR